MRLLDRLKGSYTVQEQEAAEYIEELEEIIKNLHAELTALLEATDGY